MSQLNPCSHLPLLNEGFEAKVYEVGDNFVARVSRNRPVVIQNPYIIPVLEEEYLSGYWITYSPRVSNKVPNTNIVEELSKALANSGIDFFDLKPANVGWFKDRWVVIDLGSITTGHKPKPVLYNHQLLKA